MARFEQDFGRALTIKISFSAETGHFTRALQRKKSISPLWLQMTGANVGVQLSELVTLRGHLCCAFCPQVLCFKTEVLELV